MSTTNMDAALEYSEIGWSVIPLSATQKHPLVKWKKYQTEHATDDQIVEWFERWPDADVGIVTGAISGLCVVDADNEASRLRAIAEGYESPIKVKTKRGWHYYFKHPMDGVIRGPRSGIQAGKHWIDENGLDFRGDGSYVKAPPSTNYSWVMDGYMDFDDMPKFVDYIKPQATVDRSEFQGLDSIDLSSLAMEGDLRRDIWKETEDYAKQFDNGKIPTTGGHGVHDRVFSYLSHAVLTHGVGDELEVAGRDFMERFYEEPLPEHKFKVNLDNVREKEMRNHPERFDIEGNYIPRDQPDMGLDFQAEEEEEKEDDDLVKPITVANADQLIEEAANFTYLIEPWLRKGSITQIFGYSGHGKSMFTQHALYHLAVGRSMGAYEVEKPATVLYFDWENGRATIGNMLNRFRNSFGSTENFKMWTPFISQKEISLNDQKGLMEFQRWVMAINPDVLVIDTVRSAFSGLEESKAEAWARINSILLKLRNAGFAVIWLHHSNKPSESGLGREAGSTNQLTVVETQMRITQVYEDEGTARQNAGLIARDVAEREGGNCVFQRFRQQIPRNANITVVMEIRYGKVREWSDLMERVMYVAFARDEHDNSIVVTSRSPKQKAIWYYQNNRTIDNIADSLHRPLRTIKEWVA